MTTRQFKRTIYCMGVMGLWLALATPAFAGPPAKPPCGTSGALGVTNVAPAQYAYTLGESGSQGFSFTVSSPQLQSNTGNSCDSSLQKVFGNGSAGTDGSAYLSSYDVEIDQITDNTSGLAVDAATATAIRAALSPFATAPFELTQPGSGTQTVTFVFSNSVQIPTGTYDVSVQVTAEAGTGVGTPDPQTFTIQVEEPQLVDTQAPTVLVSSPTSGSSLKLNDTLSVEFTAVDPPEGGAGTGVTAARALITSCSGGFSYTLTSALTVSPALPVAADVTVTASTVVDPWLYVGNFTLTAEADDGAGHTGSATSTFSAGTNVSALPPISVPNRQFNTGSTLPIKFVLKDGAGALLPPMDGLVVRITTPSGVVEERVAGSGAGNVRWELDEYGYVTGYITNYPVPVVGTYRVDVLVADVCGSAALQGGFNFVAATKGGKI